MGKYDALTSMLGSMNPATSERMFHDIVAPYLVDVWLGEYESVTQTHDIVETLCGRFRYLFDIGNRRLIAAWGTSEGRHAGARPKSRMAGHPLSDGPEYHRGHAIPHTLGGQTDINLVPQRGAINIGEFRTLEIRAVQTPGSFYFSHWIYGKGSFQRPTRVEQGLLVACTRADIRTFAN